MTLQHCKTCHHYLQFSGEHLCNCNTDLTIPIGFVRFCPLSKEYLTQNKENKYGKEKDTHTP